MAHRPITIWHVLTLALISRLLTLVFLPDQNFPDARSFTNSGVALMSTGQMAVEIYMPLYPIWNFLWGGGWGVKLGDILLSVATIGLLWRLSLHLFNSRLAAIIAALVAALYPHFLFYAVSGLTETAFIFLLVVGYYCLYRERYVAGSVVLVLSILVRPAIDPIAPLLVFGFALIVHRRPFRFAAGRVAIYAATYVVLMAPWWVHNYSLYGEFVRLNLGDGIVLYSGNNPENKTGGGVGYDEEKKDMEILAFRAIRDPVERNAAYKRAAWEFVSENPGRFIELAGLKFLRFWRLWPYAPDYERPAIIAISLLSYGVVLALTLAFLFREARRRWRDLSPILGLVAYLTAVHMITIGSIRYRLPLEPFMIIFMAHHTAALIEKYPRLHAATVRITGMPDRLTTPSHS